MKVSLERSGGLAGLQQILGPVDIDDMSTTARRDVLEQLSRAKEECIPTRRAMPDAFSYQLTIEGAGGAETVVIGAERQLVQALKDAGASWRPVRR